MAFMVPEYLKGDWYEVETNCGTEVVPADLTDGTVGDLAQYIEGSRIGEVTKRHGVGARLSAPGYMDCTEWSVFDTIEEARAFIAEQYDADPDTGDDLEDESDED